MCNGSIVGPHSASGHITLCVCVRSVICHYPRSSPAALAILLSLSLSSQKYQWESRAFLQLAFEVWIVTQSVKWRLPESIIGMYRIVWGFRLFIRSINQFSDQDLVLRHGFTYHHHHSHHDPIDTFYHLMFFFSSCHRPSLSLLPSSMFHVPICSSPFPHPFPSLLPAFAREVSLFFCVWGWEGSSTTPCFLISSKNRSVIPCIVFENTGL